jgi:hypothetical protein
MAAKTENGGGPGGIPWRMIGWGGAALLLLLPWVANAPWTLSDFVVMGLLFGLVGGGLELAVRTSSNLSCRLGAAVAILAAFLTLWVNGAVGMIGSEGNPYNLVFLGVPALALAGAVFARFRPEGMSRAMIAAAIAQAAAGAAGLPSDMLGGIFSAGFALFWLLAAALFRNAAREQAPAGAA